MLPTISFMITLAKNDFQDYKTFRMICNFSKLSHQQQHLQNLTVLMSYIQNLRQNVLWKGRTLEAMVISHSEN